MPNLIRRMLASALLVMLATAAAAQDHVPGELLVRWKSSVKPAARTQALSPLGAQRVRAFRTPGLEQLRVLGVSVEEAVARLSLDPRVEYAEPNLIWSIGRAPSDPRYPDQYALHNTGQGGGTPGADIGAEGAWDRYTGDPVLLIGVLDTGAQLDHPDLAANLWTNPGEVPGNAVDDDGNGYVDDVHGYDFFNHDGDPSDDNGHGTHTAGTIAAVGDNGIGVTGVLWRARIVVLKFLNSSGSGPTSGAVEALDYAVRLGVRVTNNSWGGGVYSRALEDAIAGAGAAGQLFVAAAGNSRTNTDVNANYPSALAEDCIVSVAATDAADQLAAFSNYGATSVDLAAPGDAILSTFTGGTYRTLSGTSMAAPHVTGAVALLMGRFPAMDPVEVKSRLLRLSDPLPALAGRCVSGGRLDLDLASADPDMVAPGVIADLRAVAPGSNSADLAWTATGDDGAAGGARSYELRVSLQPITPANFAQATLFAAPRPQAAGSAEAWRLRGLAHSTTYWCALRARDEFGNAGPVSNAITFTTLGPPRLAFAPGEVTAAASTGTALVRSVDIVNESAGTLEWTALAPVLDLGAGAAAGGAAAGAWPAGTLAKGEDGLVREPGTASAGGPDAFGYRWLDSDQPGGPVFQWVDIATAAHAVPLSGDEAVSVRLPIGFSFPFYGRRFTDVRVCSNGYLEFSDQGALFVNSGLPSAGAPRNLVAPFWEDLNLGAGTTRVFLRSDGARCVVSWEGVPRFGDPASVMTFQAILYPSGEVRFQYRTMTGNTSNATVGIQDSSRTVGLTVAFNQPYVKDGLAVRIVPLRQWLTVSPAEGFVPPGGRQAVSLRLDASGLGTGEYRGQARFITNDPDANDTSVVVRLTVAGAPHLVLAPAGLDFGSHFVGAHDSLSVTVANDGVDPLEVAGLVTDPAVFRAPPGGFTLLPGESVSLPVEFTPAAVAAYAGTLTLTSNDPVTPVARVELRGVGSATPEIELSAERLTVAATPRLGEAAAAPERVVLIRNFGGAPLTWTASAYQGLVGARSAAVAAAPPPPPVPPLAKGEVAHVLGTLGDGGPDAFGYRWLDSDAPGGPVFGWEEIAGVGTRLFGSADDSVTTLRLPFPFTFYGRTYDSVNVCTNGFLSFESRDSTFANTDLPSAAPGVPRALVAPFWTDFDLRAVRESGRAYAHHDGSKFILEWKDVVHFSGASPYTFQVLLWPSGAIDFQYLALGALTTSGTVGIQDASGGAGLRVAWNAPYLKPGLRVRFMYQDDWLRLDRRNGSTAPGAVDTLRVTFDSRDHADGDYVGEVRIQSNDVQQPLLVVPCALHVGLQTAPAEAQPGVVAAVSHAPGVRFLLSPAAAGEGVRLPSLRLAGGSIVPASDPRHEPDGRLSLEFRAVDLLALPAPAAGSPWVLSGEYETSGWFEAAAALEVRAPSLAGGPLPGFGSAEAPPVLRAGEGTELTWQPPAGGADDYAVAWSSDGGLRWTELGHPVAPRFTLVPPEPSPAALVEVVARRGDAVLGTWLTAPFTVEPGVAPPSFPTRFAFVRTGAHPARGGTTLELSLPAATDVDVRVYDTRGARVRTLARGAMAPGRVPLPWDGRDDSGRRVPAGIYLVRALAGGNEAVVRIALLR